VGFGHCEPFRANAPELTEREREVLRRITDGQSTRQIAKGLDISPATARTHAHNVLVKLGVRSRVQAAATSAPAVPVMAPVPVPPDPASDDDLLATLTAREHDVLAGMVDGLARAAIAERLGLSPHTVRTHARNLLGKLGVHSTLEAAALVRRVRAGPSQSSWAQSRRQADALRSAVHVGRLAAYEPGQRHPGLAGQFHRQ
jgi:DNA-binding NarL/FixJ family response regulator